MALPTELSTDVLNTITLYVALPSQSSIDVLHTTKPTDRSRTVHIYRKQMDSWVNQAQMPSIPLHPLLDLGQCIYIEERWPPSQSSIDTLHTATPTARSRTMHIYLRQMDLPVQSSMDALNTATPNILAYHNAIWHRSSPVNRAQMSCILLQPLLDLVQCMYIEGRWTPQFNQS